MPSDSKLSPKTSWKHIKISVSYEVPMWEAKIRINDMEQQIISSLWNYNGRKLLPTISPTLSRPSGFLFPNYSPTIQESPIFRPSWSSNPNHSFKDYHCAFLSSAHLIKPAISIIPVIIWALRLTHCTRVPNRPHGRGENNPVFLSESGVSFFYSVVARFSAVSSSCLAAISNWKCFPQNASN